MAGYIVDHIQRGADRLAATHQVTGADNPEPLALCFDGKTAARIGEALGLLDGLTRPGAIKILPNGGMRRRLDGSLHWLSDDEILIRAREAAIAAGGWVGMAAKVRAGEMDEGGTILAVARALRDLAKPLDEIRPKVADPDLIEARKIAAGAFANRNIQEEYIGGSRDKCSDFQRILAAIKRGRELERDGAPPKDWEPGGYVKEG
jgi:hypothetical protein